MKTSMEWFNEKAEFNKWLKELTENERELLLFLIVDVQSEAYNEGVKDAAENAKVKYIRVGATVETIKQYETIVGDMPVVDKESILSLIKK